MSKDKEIKKLFMKELEKILDFISQTDPMIVLTPKEIITDMKNIMEHWKNINFKKKKFERAKNNILECMEKLVEYLRSSSYFNHDTHRSYIQPVKDPSRANYNRASKEILKLRFLFMENYFILFYSSELERLEIEIITAVYNAIKARENDPVRLNGTTEVHFTNDIFDIVQAALDDYIKVSREMPSGFANKGTGETDLFFSTKIKGIYKNLAIGEVKEWGKFSNQLNQLMGYMKHYTTFGFNIILNKKVGLDQVQRSITEKLTELQEEGADSITKVFKFTMYEETDDVYVSLHRNPETGTKFRVYHFIANAYLPERKEVAKKARR